MKRLIKVLLFAATMMFVAGCITDRFFLDPPDPSDTDVDVLLKLKTPGGMSNPRTRALSYDDENTIEDIFVLVFQNDILNSIKIGESVDWESTPSAGGDSSVRYSGEGSFEVTLRQSRGESDRYKLMVLANLGEVDGMRDILDGLLLARAGYPDVLAALSIGVTGPLYAEGGTIPMWGEKSDVVVMPSNNELEVELMRSVARIDVGVGAKPTIDNPLTDAWRWDGMEPDGTTPIPFVLTEVYVMQPGNLFSVIPAPGNVKAPSGESPGEVTAPTIPGGTSPVPPAGSEKYSYFKFSDGDITGGKYTTRSIYVPESDVLMTRSGLSESEQHISRMALVVGGIFNDDPEGTTYYRIDFSDGGGMMDVLRNHLYQFSISKVLGPGRPTVEEAYEASAMKMEVNIIDWNEIGLGNIWVLGDMWFSISDLEVMFTPLDQQTARVKISTNVPDFAMSLGGEERLVAGRVTSWESDYYSYKLIEDRENAYTLEISTLSSNVSQSSLEAASRLEEWFIDVGWVSNIGFKVDQGWQSTYISVINGQTSYLYPEGAVGEEALSLDIVSSKPVTITVEPESAAGSGGWIGGLVSELPQTMGIWSANMRLEVSPLAHDPSHPEETSRTATIHIAVGDETPIAYTVTQESPYLSLTSSDLVIDRSGATTQKVAGWVTVQTNLPADHLDLAVGQMSGLGVIPLSLVSSSSRNLSFGVEVDADDPEEGFTTTFSVTPREGGAEAIPDYGMDGVSGTIMVRNANDVFRFLWRGGAFRGNGPDEWPWTPATGDQDADRRMDYIFPWSTERVKFDLISNIGGTLLAPDLITGGSLESGDPTTEVDVSTTPWVFTFSDDHTALLTPTFTLMSRSISTYIIVGFSRGPQEWAFDEGFDASWGYTGTGGAGSSSPLTVRSNISWGASSDQEWLTLKTGGGALASSAMRDDHTGFTAPVYPLEDETPAQTRARLTTAGPLDVHIDPITTLNDLAGSNYRRHAAVTFTNRSEGGTNLSLGERTLIVTQHSPVLQPKSNTIPIPAGEVEHTGGKVDFIATTNLAGWGVRIYSNTDNEGAITPDPRLLTTGGEWPFTGEANIDATTAPDPNGHRVSVTVPQYRGATPRELIFHLYCTEFPDTEIEAGRATQLSGYFMLPLKSLLRNI